ncbi:MAG: DNA polymerase III subunit delta [Phycisphaerae bacterium]
MVAAGVNTKPDSPRPIHVIYSPPKKGSSQKDPADLETDEFLRTETLHDLLNNLLGDEYDRALLTEFEGPSAELSEVLDACRTPSLFSNHHVVCVRNADLVDHNRCFLKSYRADLEKYLIAFDLEDVNTKKTQSPPPDVTGILVLVCRSWPKSTRLYKLTERIGRNWACEPPVGDRGFTKWIVDRALNTYGCKITPQAATRLFEHIGKELGLLNMELAKLSIYVDSRNEIRTCDIVEIVGISRLEKIFGLTDAIADHQPEKALELWHQVLASDKDAPYRAIGGLAWGFRKLAEAKGGKPTYGGSRSLGQQLQRFTLSEWRQHLIELLKIDVGAKTGLGSVESSVEKFIVELSAQS